MNNPSPSKANFQVSFLGLCERAHYVREGNTNLFKWNVIGLKQIVLSYVFPFKLEGWYIGLAFERAAIDQELRFRIVNQAGNEIGTLNISAQASLTESNEGQGAEYEKPIMLMPECGATSAFLPLGDTGWVIESPGFYYLEQLVGTEYYRIGMINFVAVEAPPLSLERIAAIKTDLGAAKAVRITFGCKHCPSTLQAYSALERSDKSESEGWVWYLDLPEAFTCECGATVMDLHYVRRNLHGVLGYRRRDTSQLSFMPLYEKSSLEDTSTEFSQLIARNPREELLQQFINKNPILLHQFPAERIIVKPKILTSYCADFGIITPQKELLLIELEKTTTRLMTKDGDMAAPLTHAFDQVRNWLHEIDEHRLAVLDSLDIERDAVSVVRGIVIAGRDVGYDSRNLRRLKGADYGRVAFLTYDDILFALGALIRRIEVM